MGSSVINFTFDKEGHRYIVPGEFAWSTSDVISINGLCDMGSVPQKVLDNASWRGDQLHRSVELFEIGTLDVSSIDESILPYFRAYMKFREEYEFQPIPPYETPTVYRHQGTEILIGATIDLRGFVKGVPCIVDLKSCFNYTGAARKQLHLRWRLQLQSYLEATEADEQFMEALESPMGKIIVHCHKDASYTAHDFSLCDDSHLWDSAIRMAQARLSNGFKVPNK